jgi:hypothetical protein
LVDPPDVRIEENWLQKVDRRWEVELVCSAPANPPAEVNIFTFFLVQAKHIQLII